jgi:hypothetical protein
MPIRDFSFEPTNLSEFGDDVDTNLDTSMQDINLDNPPDVEQLDRFKEISKGVVQYPELNKKIPSDDSRSTAGCCQYFGFPSGKALTSFI